MGLKIVGKIELPKEKKTDVKTREKVVKGLKNIKTIIPTTKFKIEELWDKQQGKCYYCGRKCIIKRSTTSQCKPNTATVEHLIRKDDLRALCGARNDYIVMSCYQCNHDIGNFDYEVLHCTSEYRQDYPLTEFINYNKWWKKIIRWIKRVLSLK